jgi:hypothetical protein
MWTMRTGGKKGEMGSTNAHAGVQIRKEEKGAQNLAKKGTGYTKETKQLMSKQAKEPTSLDLDRTRSEQENSHTS